MTSKTLNGLQFLVFAGVLAGLWWVLTEGALHSWPVGLPAVVLCAWLAQRLHQPESTGIQLRRLPAFAGHFLFRSLLAGVDVAWRTLHPRLPLKPGFVFYPLRLKNPRGRLFFAAVISLLPGTLSAQLHTDGVLLHVLDTDVDIARDSLATEQQIAHLLGEAAPTEPCTLSTREDTV